MASGAAILSQVLRTGCTITSPQSTVAYYLEHQLGEGASGQVWLVFSSTLSWHAAKFVLLDEAQSLEEARLAAGEFLREKASSTDEALDGFVPRLDEVFAIEALHSESNTRAGLMVIVMEYIDGYSLDKIVSCQRLYEGHAAAILRSICLALQRLHGDGRLHRDVKSSNIMVSFSGRVCFCDFGLSRCIKKVGLQRMVAGTPLYMAPEILDKVATEDNLRQIDNCSFGVDVWSVGILAIELVQGFLHLDQDSASHVFHTLATQAPPSLPKVFSPALRRFVGRCLVKDPKQRATVRELLMESETFLNPLPNNSKLLQDLVSSRRLGVEQRGSPAEALRRRTYGLRQSTDTLTIEEVRAELKACTSHFESCPEDELVPSEKDGSLHQPWRLSMSTVSQQRTPGRHFRDQCSEVQLVKPTLQKELIKSWREEQVPSTQGEIAGLVPTMVTIDEHSTSVDIAPTSRTLLENVDASKHSTSSLRLLPTVRRSWLDESILDAVILELGSADQRTTFLRGVAHISEIQMPGAIFDSKGLPFPKNSSSHSGPDGFFEEPMQWLNENPEHVAVPSKMHEERVLCSAAEADKAHESDEVDCSNIAASYLETVLPALESPALESPADGSYRGCTRWQPDSPFGQPNAIDAAFTPAAVAAAAAAAAAGAAAHSPRVVGTNLAAVFRLQHSPSGRGSGRGKGRGNKSSSRSLQSVTQGFEDGKVSQQASRPFQPAHEGEDCLTSSTSADSSLSTTQTSEPSLVWSSPSSSLTNSTFQRECAISLPWCPGEPVDSLATGTASGTGQQHVLLSMKAPCAATLLEAPSPTLPAVAQKLRVCVAGDSAPEPENDEEITPLSATLTALA